METTTNFEKKQAIDVQIRNWRERLALTINKYIMVSNLIAAILLAAMWFLTQFTQLLIIVGFVLLIAIASALYPTWHRRGQTIIGIYFVLGSILLLVSVVSFLSPELFAPVALSFVAVILFGILFLGSRGGLWVSGVGITVFLADVVLTKVIPVTWFTPLDETAATVINIALSTMAMLFIALITYHMMARQETHFVRLMDEHKQAEVERDRLQQEIIETQQRAIRELSTPIIPVMDRIIVMPLIGSIDSLRAKDIMQALLAGISQYDAKTVILDITGVPIVDSGVVAYLNKAVQAARLKGARTIVTGISDSVAETIVDLGIEWKSIETLRDLQTGLVTALKGMGMRLSQL
jgi:anti-anti-sigma regulatory factor